MKTPLAGHCQGGWWRWRWLVVVVGERVAFLVREVVVGGERVFCGGGAKGESF